MAPDQPCGRTVVIVDDDPGMRDSVAALLEMSGFPIRHYGTAESFLADPGACDRVGCLLIDQHFSGMSGTDLLRRLSARGRMPPAILFSARLTETIIREARSAGALAVLDKPVGPMALIRHLWAALQVVRTVEEF